jgi:hypothetical protein
MVYTNFGPADPRDKGWEAEVLSGTRGTLKENKVKLSL